ncbi:MAG: alpha/beta hydrolase [Bacteroidota bacterium]
MITFRTGDQQVESYFKKKDVPVEVIRTQWQGKDIRYLKTEWKSDVNCQILFLHGGPGSSNNFHKYLSNKELLQEARLLALDRLGYGFSDYGRFTASLQQHAAVSKYVLDQHPSNYNIIVGHSFGGPIAGKVAADYPKKIHAALMISPLNEPETEPIFWISHFARWKWSKSLLPIPVQLAGDEKFTHAEELRKIQPDWRSICCTITHMHGSWDFLAPLSNVFYSQKNIPAKYLHTIVIKRAGHLLPFTHFDDIKNELLRLIAVIKHNNPN